MEPKKLSPQYLAELLHKSAKEQGLDSEQEKFLLQSLIGDKFQKPLSILELLKTQDAQMIKAKEKIEKLKNKMINVLIIGESGTGKELLAQALNEGKVGPFIGVNCASIPDSLFESLFFGAVKGSYTGCTKDTIGFFEQSQNGTLFLDEISEIPFHLQAKLLRVIETRVLRKVGSDEDRPFNCRIVSATNMLDLMNKPRLFREDLYYRLRGAIVETTPLSKRRDDIRIIVDYFDKQDQIPVEMIEAWINDVQTWPFKGNVRELKNLIEEYICLNS